MLLKQDYMIVNRVGIRADTAMCPYQRQVTSRERLSGVPRR